jgi:hypothetical protein
VRAAEGDKTWTQPGLYPGMQYDVILRGHELQKAYEPIQLQNVEHVLNQPEELRTGIDYVYINVYAICMDGTEWAVKENVLLQYAPGKWVPGVTGGMSEMAFTATTKEFEEKCTNGKKVPVGEVAKMGIELKDVVLASGAGGEWVLDTSQVTYTQVPQQDLPDPVKTPTGRGADYYFELSLTQGGNKESDQAAFPLSVYALPERVRKLKVV